MKPASRMEPAWLSWLAYGVGFLAGLYAGWATWGIQ